MNITLTYRRLIGYVNFIANHLCTTRILISYYSTILQDLSITICFTGISNII